MRKVKILHCADIHIGATASSLGTSAAKRRAEVLLTFEKILDTARERSVELLLIAGDLFDSNRIEAELFNRVFEAIGAISPINVIIAAGNHDPLTADSPYLSHKLPDNLHIFSGNDSVMTFEDLGVRVYGRSFTGSYMQGSPEFSITPPTDEYINIMLLHGDLSGNLSSNYNHISNQFIASSGMDYIALGHIHKRSEILSTGGTHYAYCGCPEGLGFDELGEKGIYIGTVEKGVCNLEFERICKRIYTELPIDISGIAPSEISQHVLENLRKIKDYSEHLYKISLVGSIAEGTSLPLDEIESRLSNEVYFVKVRDNTAVKADFEAISKEHSLKGIFVRRMLERLDNSNSDEQHALLEQALNIGLRAFYSEVKYRDDK